MQDEICITNNSFIVIQFGSEHSVPLWFSFSYNKNKQKQTNKKAFKKLQGEKEREQAEKIVNFLGGKKTCWRQYQKFLQVCGMDHKSEVVCSK